MTRINLIPAPVQMSQRRRRHTARWLVAAMLSLSAVAVSLGYEWLRRAEAGELHARSQQLQLGLRQARAKLEATTTEVQQTRIRIDRANALRSKRAWSGLITLIGENLPDTCWLTSIATDPTAPTRQVRRTPARPGAADAEEAPRAITIDAPRKLKLAGFATEAAEPHALVAALKETGAFTRVAVLESQRQPVHGGMYYRFELVCEW